MSYLLYSFRRCPYAIRTRMALHYSQVTYKIIEVDLKNKPTELCAISPKATVPVLQATSSPLLNSFVLEESWDIMRWALERDSGRYDKDKLWFKNTLQHQQVTLIEHNDREFKYDLDRYKYPNRYETKSSMQTVLQQKSYENCCKTLDTYEKNLICQPYLLGKLPCLADIALLSFVRQFANVEINTFAHRFPKLTKWLYQWLNTSLFKEIMAKDYEGFDCSRANDL